MVNNVIIQTGMYHPTMIVRVSAKLTDHAKSYQRTHYHVKRDRLKKKTASNNMIFFKYFYGPFFFFVM